MDWKVPDNVEKDIELESITDEQVEYYHDQMHVFWKKLEEGYYFGWAIRDIYLMHKIVVIELLKRKIGHVSPVGGLDKVSFTRDIKDLNKKILDSV